MVARSRSARRRPAPVSRSFFSRDVQSNFESIAIAALASAVDPTIGISVPNSLRRKIVSDRWFNRLVVGAFVLGFLALLGAGFAATQAILQNQGQTRWVNHTYQVERSISRFRVLVERLEAARRGYLLRNEHGLSRTFTETANQIGPALAEMRLLSEDNPRQQANIEAITALTEAHMDTLARSVALVSAGKREEAVATFNQGASLDLIRAIRASADRSGGCARDKWAVRDVDRRGWEDSAA